MVEQMDREIEMVYEDVSAQQLAMIDEVARSETLQHRHQLESSINNEFKLLAL